MRRLIPLLVLLAAACAQTKPVGEPADPTEMGRPRELEQREEARLAPEEGRAPDERSTSRVLAYVNGEVITYRDILLRAGPQLAVLGEADRNDVDLLDDVDAVRVVQSHLAYFEAIGAVGPQAGLDDVI